MAEAILSSNIVHGVSEPQAHHSQSRIVRAYFLSPHMSEYFIVLSTSSLPSLTSLFSLLKSEI
jgi:hypothetical protein